MSIRTWNLVGRSAVLAALAAVCLGPAGCGGGGGGGDDAAERFKQIAAKGKQKAGEGKGSPKQAQQQQPPPPPPRQQPAQDVKPPQHVKPGAPPAAGAPEVQPVQAKTPAGFDEAVIFLKDSDTGKKLGAAVFLAGKPLDAERRAEVARGLEALLKDNDADVRKRALEALKVWADADSVPALLGLLDDRGLDSESVLEHRQLALEVLGKLKDPKAATAVAALLPSREENELAVKVLLAMGPSAESEVLKYAFRREARAREAVRTLMAAYKTKESLVLDRALAELKSADLPARRGVAEWLAEGKADPTRQAQIADALMAQLRERDAPLREAALRALLVWAGKDNVAALIEVASDRPPNLFLPSERGQAMLVLARLKDERGVAPVAARLTVPADRQAAGKALEEMGLLAAKEVGKYLAVSDAAARAEAERVLKAIGKGENLGVTQALGDLQSDDKGRRAEGLEWLARAHVDKQRRAEVVKAVVPFVQDKNQDPKVLEAAARALGTWGGKESVEPLAALLNNEKTAPPVRRAALDALGRLKEENGVAPLVKQLLNQQDRSYAAKALIVMGDMAEPQLVKLLKSREKEVTLDAKVEACKVLKSVGTRNCLQDLQEVARTARLYRQRELADAALDAYNTVAKKK